jgi:hypothetical protein
VHDVFICCPPGAEDGVVTEEKVKKRNILKIIPNWSIFGLFAE